jgi:hypothetical protein
MPPGAVTSAYTGLKDLIQSTFNRGAAIAVLESDPAAKAAQEVVKAALAKTDAGTDEEVLRPARALLQATRDSAPQAAQMAAIS